MNKNFSVLKWIIFPILVSFFGIGICYVSLKIFGLSGSVPSILLIVVCLAISLIFILHTNNHRVKSAMIAAFTFECLGITALGITLVCSIIILRQFSGVSETLNNQNSQELKVGEQKTEQLKIIAGFKSAKAQNTATKTIEEPQPKDEKQKITLAQIYDKAESFLLYPLIGEASVYLLGLLIVFGLVQFQAVEGEESQQLETPPTMRVRVSTPPQTAPFMASGAYTVENGNGFFLSLTPSGNGKAIRFRERGSQAQHVLRIPQSRVESERLVTMDYKSLALWSLKALEDIGKSNKPVYEKIKQSL